MSSSNENPFKIDGFGITLKKKPSNSLSGWGGYYVVSIDDNSLIHRRDTVNLNVGDEITQVNYVSIMHFNPQRLMELFKIFKIKYLIFNRPTNKVKSANMFIQFNYADMQKQPGFIKWDDDLILHSTSSDWKNALAKANAQHRQQHQQQQHQQHQQQQHRQQQQQQHQQQ